MIEQLVAAGKEAGFDIDPKHAAFALGYGQGAAAGSQEGKNDDDKWIVYYHNGFSGRAQVHDMMLEYAGAAWERKPKSDCKDPSVFAVPAVQKGDKCLSQTTAAAAWLGDELGLAPPAGLAFEALKMADDIADIWSEAYGKRKSAKTWEEAEDFIGSRLAKFFGVVEAMVIKCGAGFCLGDKPCYVDFLWLNAVETCKGCYGADRLAPALAAAPTAVAIATKLAAMPKVAACMKREPVLYGSVMHSGRMPF